MIYLFFLIPMLLISFEDEIIEKFDFKKYTESTRIGLISLGVVSLTRAASILVHELGHAACGKIFFNSPIQIIIGNYNSEKNLINFDWLKIKRSFTYGGSYFFSPDKSFDCYNYIRLIIPEKTVAGFHIKPKGLPSSMRLKMITLLAAGPIAAGSCNYVLYKENWSYKYVNSIELGVYLGLFKISMIINGANNFLNLLPLEKSADGYKILQLTGMSHSAIKMIKNPCINAFLLTGILLNYPYSHRKFNHDQ